MAAFELFWEEQNRFCSPTQAVILVSAYVAFVTKVGPYLMRNKPALQLTKILQVYNFIQIILNALLFIRLLELTPRKSFFCFPPLRRNDLYVIESLNAHYYYYLLKILDFLDTVFMVLRKKHHQVSFLHVYHHITTYAMAWYTGAYYPGGFAICVGLGNTFVHSIMYLYYLVSSLHNNSRKIIWWKKYVTITQLVQHWILLFFAICSIANTRCDYMKQLSALGLCNMMILIYFFSKFYKDNYVSPKENVN